MFFLNRDGQRVWPSLFVGAALVLLLLAVQGVPADEDPYAPFVEEGFPFITTTLDAGHLAPVYPARNLAVRGVVLVLGGDTYACFDPDLLRLAVGWQGAFMSMETMAQVSYQEAGNKQNGIPEVLGTPIVATGLYPGWQGDTLAFADPRPPGPNPADVGRGPLPAEMGRWDGLYVVGDEAVLAYTVHGTQIFEQPGSVRAGGETGLVRTFRVAQTRTPLTLIVGEVGNAAAAEGAPGRVVVQHGAAGDTVTVARVVALPPGASLRVERGRYITLRLPAGLAPATFSVVVWRGAAAAAGAFDALLEAPARMATFAGGGPAHWPQEVVTQGAVAPDTSAFVVDSLALPLPNPWRRNVRLAGLDFFDDGRAALVTFDGDVWIVSGIDEGLKRLAWRRFASGLYEPLSLKIVDGQVYVYERGQVTRFRDLNGDGEADFYENFSDLVIESGESREYPLDMAERPGGGFYLSKGAALDNGPQTSPSILPGFRAGSRHSGSVLAVSADGRSLRTYASGLREPFLGVHPQSGLVTASDQQGNFVPSTPIYVIEEGGYYGVPATAHRPDVPAEEVPLTWIPHQVDQSGAGQVWVTGGRMGPLDGALVHLSYGEPGAFRVYFDSTDAGLQGGIVELPGDFYAPLMKGAVHPGDGQLYATGFQVWGSKAQAVSGLMRIRYTGQPSPLPSSMQAGAEGVVIRFEAPVDPASLDVSALRVRRWNYRRTEQYGSGHFRTDGTEGREELPVVAVQRSADGKGVLLVVPRMQEVMQMEVAYDLRSTAGLPLEGALYLTVNHAVPLPLAEAGFAPVDWQQAAAAAEAQPSEETVVASAALGAELYERLGCIGCHSVDGSVEGKSGPSLQGVFGAARHFADGTSRPGDAAYLRQSLLDPASQIVQGYEQGMPPYRGVLTDAELESLILFIQSLAE